MSYYHSIKTKFQKVDSNTKAVVILFIVTFIIFLSHRSNLFSTSISLIHGDQVNLITEIRQGNVNNKLRSNNEEHAIECHLEDASGFNLCGISIHLGDESSHLGIDLRHYNHLELSLNYVSPNKDKNIRVSFRNYHDNYSKTNDTASLKYNTITYAPSDNKTEITVPLSVLQVETWWKTQYNINFDDSLVDLSNITKIDFTTDLMSTPGVYEIHITKVILTGQFISETNLLRLFLIIWLLTFLALVTRQRNKLKQVSNTDHLTGLYNRRGILNWVNNGSLFRGTKRRINLFYFDIDNFKKINDSYGHVKGDLLLIALSQRIKQFLNSQVDSHIFARLSGDEFIILFNDLTPTCVDRLASGILNTLQKPFKLEKHSIFVQISLGIAQSDSETKRFEDLLSRADSTMYYAKRSGKNQYKVFNEHVANDLFFKKKIAERIEHAITEHKFNLSYMPIYCSYTKVIKKVEVLIRSTDDLLKEAGSDVFIPIAEEFGLIKKIDLWVIEQAFIQMTKASDLLDKSNIIFCINISSLELHNSLFTSQLETLLSAYNIKTNRLEFELTETSLIETDQRCIDILKEIRHLGIKLALDDFGTGYTAFNQLIHYPVNALKIDKSFLDKLHCDDKTSETMIKAILSIAQSYGLETVAEGIENQEQYDFLTEHHCDYMQGYFFAKPMPWEELNDLLLPSITENLFVNQKITDSDTQGLDSIS